MHHKANPELVDLYERAVICRTFPGAYRLDDLKDIAARREALWAMELLDLAIKANS